MRYTELQNLAQKMTYYNKITKKNRINLLPDTSNGSKSTPSGSN